MERHRYSLSNRPWQDLPGASSPDAIQASSRADAVLDRCRRESNLILIFRDINLTCRSKRSKKPMVTGRSASLTSSRQRYVSRNLAGECKSNDRPDARIRCLGMLVLKTLRQEMARAIPPRSAPRTSPTLRLRCRPVVRCTIIPAAAPVCLSTIKRRCITLAISTRPMDFRPCQSRGLGDQQPARARGHAAADTRSRLPQHDSSDGITSKPDATAFQCRLGVSEANSAAIGYDLECSICGSTY